MYKIIYKEKSVEIQENLTPAGWHPLWNTIIDAFSFSDISNELLVKLSQEDYEMIAYFFDDLENPL